MIYLELVKVQLLQKSRKLIMGYAIVLSCLSRKPSVQVFPTYTIYLTVQLAKKLHPDTNKDDPEAEKKFQEVQKAYEVCDWVTIFATVKFPDDILFPLFNCVMRSHSS